MFKCPSIGHRAPASGWLLSLLVVALLQVGRARASESDAFVQFRWQRGPSAQSCPAQGEVEQLVRLRLGRDPFAPNAPRIIEASIERTGPVWHVELRQHDANGPMQGQRVFDVPDDFCAQVADAAALAVALAIDPNASIASISGAAVGEPTPKRESLPAQPSPPQRAAWTAEPTPSPPRYDSPPAAPPPRPDTPYTLRLTLRGLLAGGLLPGGAPGLGVAGGVGGRYLAVTLGASYWPEASVKFNDSRFAFGLTTLDTGACGTGLRTQHFVASGCAQFHAGAVHSVVSDAVPVHPGDHFFWALSIGPRLDWRSFAPFVVEVGTEAWVAPSQPTYFYADHQLYQVRLVSVVAFLGVGWASN